MKKALTITQWAEHQRIYRQLAAARVKALEAAGKIKRGPDVIQRGQPVVTYYFDVPDDVYEGPPRFTNPVPPSFWTNPFNIKRGVA